MLQSIKNVRLYRPQHKVHHGIRYVDFLVHSMYLIAWYYCKGDTYPSYSIIIYLPSVDIVWVHYCAIAVAFSQFCRYVLNHVMFCICTSLMRILLHNHAMINSANRRSSMLINIFAIGLSLKAPGRCLIQALPVLILRLNSNLLCFSLPCLN